MDDLPAIVVEEISLLLKANSGRTSMVCRFHGKLKSGGSAMSLESAKQCLEKMKTDVDFRDQVHKASVEDRKELFKQAGFDFSLEEMQKASGELADDDLDQVAGGSTSWSCWEHYS